METKKMEVLRQGWKPRTVVISKDNIGMFKAMMDRRDISPGNVKSLVKSMEERKHFQTPMIVNEKPDGMPIIDGNHRADAIGIMILRHPGFAIEVTLMVYPNVSDKAEKELFCLHNKGKRIKTNDFLKVYWNDIPITKYFEELPMEIKWRSGANTLNLKMILDTYLAKPGGMITTRFTEMVFINKAKALTYNDFLKIKAFLIDFIGVFGTIGQNHYYKGLPFTIIMRLWLDNRRRLSPKNLRNRLSKLLRYKDMTTRYAGQGAGTGNCFEAHKNFLDAINRRLSKSNALRLV